MTPSKVDAHEQPNRRFVIDVQDPDHRSFTTVAATKSLLTYRRASGIKISGTRDPLPYLATGSDGSVVVQLRYVHAQIDWTFHVGEQVKLRLVNEMDSDHPMPHPFHVHGAGRFLILARDDVVEPNLVWKDTVLVRTGETVDILLDVTNPGRSMAYCLIAEHHESGMMFSFNVTD
jgi:FtsP/CotA-like multicopper oxidase with cupredoxin domain